MSALARLAGGRLWSSEYLLVNDLVSMELEALEKVTEKVERLTVFGGLDGVMSELVKLRPNWPLVTAGLPAVTGFCANTFVQTGAQSMADCKLVGELRPAIEKGHRNRIGQQLRAGWLS